MNSLVFDFDEINQWGHILSKDLAYFVDAELVANLRISSPEYIEDAGSFVFAEVEDQPSFVAHIQAWIKAKNVVVYHGSRLTSDELESVKKFGLTALVASNRVSRYRAMLLNHPDWRRLIVSLPDIITKITTVSYAGRREGQVHATLSRSALTNGFNHYLKYGSEFDQHVMWHLLEDEGLELLQLYAKPTLIQLVVSGKLAFKAGHRFQIDENDVPSLIRAIINSWAYWLVYPDYTPKSIELDWGVIFEETIPPNWINQITILNDEDLAQ